MRDDGRGTGLSKLNLRRPQVAPTSTSPPFPDCRTYILRLSAEVV